MTENQGKKVRFGVIDVFIILAIIAILVAFGFYASGKWQDNSNGALGSDMTYTVEVSDVSYDVAETFRKGDPLRDSRKDTSIGEIADVGEIVPYTVPTENAQDGTYVSSQKPDKYAVRLEVKSGYQLSGNDIKIDDVDIKVGTSIILKGEGYAANATILAINR